MERTALPGRLAWQLGRVVQIDDEPRTRSLLLDVPGWPGHTAGQHGDVRLTAEDGDQARRSYSLASPPEARHVTLTVERLDDGAVSPSLTEVLQCGDQLELRGPLLIGGGSGIVPLMAMIHQRTARQSMGAYPEDGTKIVARATICATGVAYRRLGLPREEHFKAAGLYDGAGTSAAALTDAAEQREKSVTQQCIHLDQITITQTDKYVCEDCIKTGDRWVHLRMCLSCGHAGCCDSSKNRHATKHFQHVGHPLMRSIEPGESWIWCYVDQMVPGELDV